MLEAPEGLLAVGTEWLLTYLIHSSVLITVAWLAVRSGGVRAPQSQDLLWKFTALAGVVTATAAVLPRSAPEELRLTAMLDQAAEFARSELPTPGVGEILVVRAPGGRASGEPFLGEPFPGVRSPGEPFLGQSFPGVRISGERVRVVPLRASAPPRDVGDAERYDRAVARVPGSASLRRRREIWLGRPRQSHLREQLRHSLVPRPDAVVGCGSRPWPDRPLVRSPGVGRPASITRNGFGPSGPGARRHRARHRPATRASCVHDARCAMRDQI